MWPIDDSTSTLRKQRPDHLNFSEMGHRLKVTQTHGVTAVHAVLFDQVLDAVKIRQRPAA
jgi:hypothetical protein